MAFRNLLCALRTKMLTPRDHGWSVVITTKHGTNECTRTAFYGRAASLNARFRLRIRRRSQQPFSRQNYVARSVAAREKQVLVFASFEQSMKMPALRTVLEHRAIQSLRSWC